MCCLVAWGAPAGLASRYFPRPQLLPGFVQETALTLCSGKLKSCKSVPLWRPCGWLACGGAHPPTHRVLGTVGPPCTSLCEMHQAKLSPAKIPSPAGPGHPWVLPPWKCPTPWTQPLGTRFLLTWETPTLPGVRPRPPQLPVLRPFPPGTGLMCLWWFSCPATPGEPSCCHPLLLSSRRPTPCRGTPICAPTGYHLRGLGGCLAQGFGAQQRGFWHPPSPGDLLAEGWPYPTSRAIWDSCCLAAHHHGGDTSAPGTHVCRLRTETSAGTQADVFGARKPNLLLGFTKES